MKNKIYGMVLGKGTLPPGMRASDFSDKCYNGVQLRQAPRNGMAVVMRSNSADPLVWRILYGAVDLHFRSYKEAMDYCNSHNLTLLQQEDNQCD